MNLHVDTLGALLIIYHEWSGCTMDRNCAPFFKRVSSHLIVYRDSLNEKGGRDSHF